MTSEAHSESIPDILRFESIQEPFVGFDRAVGYLAMMGHDIRASHHGYDWVVKVTTPRGIITMVMTEGLTEDHSRDGVAYSRPTTWVEVRVGRRAISEESFLKMVGA